MTKDLVWKHAVNFTIELNSEHDAKHVTVEEILDAMLSRYLSLRINPLAIHNKTYIGENAPIFESFHISEFEIEEDNAASCEGDSLS